MFERTQKVLLQTQQILAKVDPAKAKKGLLDRVHEVLSLRPVFIEGTVSKVCRYKVVPHRLHIGALSKTVYHGDRLDCIGRDIMIVDNKKCRLEHLRGAFDEGWLIPETAPMPDWTERINWDVISTSQAQLQDRVPIRSVERRENKYTPIKSSPENNQQPDTFYADMFENFQEDADLGDDLSVIWDCSPDVSEAFGLPKPGLINPTEAEISAEIQEKLGVEESSAPVETVTEDSAEPVASSIF